jgi:hypothetical protein
VFTARINLLKWLFSFKRIQRLIGVEDEDSCGKSEAGEIPQERSDEEAPRSPAESEVFHGNQKQRLKAYKFKK